MKAKLFFTIVFSLFMFYGYGQSKLISATIKVYGNCSMCKKRIETALDYKGIKSAEWNIQTKELNIVYKPGKISEQKIHTLIAAVGHDTDLIKASDDVYANLPFCCLYREHSHGN